MVNNQIEFNEKFPKEAKEVRIKNKDFQGQLVIEDYTNLEKLYLRDVENIEKITLKNLPQLKWCTIRDCGVKDLAIENCPQINSLNIENNLLTSLEFLKDLDNLEELELDGNLRLSEILEPYEDDWKTYQKDLQKANRNTNALELLENIQFLKKENEFLNIKYDELKKFLKSILVSLSQEEKKGLSVELNKKINRKASLSAPGMTKELMLNTEKVVKSWKEIKKELESELIESKAKIQELEKQLAEAKARSEEREKKVEELSKEIIVNPLYTKTVEFLKAKSTFLNARRETIEELQKCFNKWDKSNRKSDVFNLIGDSISSVGGVIPTEVTFGIPQAVGQAFKVGSNFSKIVISEKGNKEFQITLKDEEELVQFNKTYDSLIELIQKNEVANNILDLKTRRLRDGKAKLFEKKYEIFDILINDGAWKERYLNFEKMEAAIISLNQNLKEDLELEWEEQFDKLKLRISKKYGNLVLQEQNIQTKIQQLKSHLGELTNSAKDKLKSKKWSAEEKEKRNQERNEILNDLLGTQTEIIRLGNTTEKQGKLISLQKKLLEIANEHGHKEFKTELDNLCQTQIELTKSELELEDLQKQQQETQILSPTEEKTQSQIEIPPK